MADCDLLGTIRSNLEANLRLEQDVYEPDLAEKFNNKVDDLVRSISLTNNKLLKLLKRNKTSVSLVNLIDDKIGECVISLFCQ
jgi:hypothetical protein